MEGWRPKRCGEYSCRLLDGYLDGTRTLEGCLEIVRDVRRTAQDAKPANAETADRPTLTPHARLAAGMLELYKRRYFRMGVGSDDPTAENRTAAREEADGHPRHVKP